MHRLRTIVHEIFQGVDSGVGDGREVKDFPPILLWSLISKRQVAILLWNLHEPGRSPCFVPLFEVLNRNNAGILYRENL